MASTSVAGCFALLAALAAPREANAQARPAYGNQGGVPLDVNAAPMRPGYIRPVNYGAPTPVPYPYPYRTRTLPYDGGPVPPGARIATHHATGLIVAGGIIFLASYAASIALWNVNATACPGGRSGCGNSAFMAVPILGPFLALSDGGTANRFGPALIADGILQVGGLAMAIIGLQITHQVIEIDEPIVPRHLRRPRAEWTVAPAASSTGVGLTAFGTF